MQKRLDPETGVNKIFEYGFMSGAYLEIFSGRGTNFCHFSSVVFFSTGIIQQLSLSNKNDSRVVQGHALPENL